MPNLNKHIKNIKIYNAKHTSFKQLKNKFFFSNFKSFTTKSIYKLPLMESFINFIKTFNHYDQYNFNDFQKLLEFEYEMAEINYEITIPTGVKSIITREIYDIYTTNKFSNFRGDLVEYLIIYLEKDKDSKTFHEPFFYHKRSRLLNKRLVVSECLIDVVKIHTKNKNISLIECKADIDVRIKRMNNVGDTFRNKLGLMDLLESILTKYVNFNNETIRVSKALASINHPHRTLPSEYKDYSYINLLDHFKLKNKNVL